MFKHKLFFWVAVLLLSFFIGMPSHADANYDAGYAAGQASAGTLVGQSSDYVSGFNDGVGNTARSQGDNYNGSTQDYHDGYIAGQSVGEDAANQGDSYLQGFNDGFAAGPASSSPPIAEPVADYSAVIPAASTYVAGILSNNAMPIIFIAVAFSGFLWLYRMIRKRTAGR